MTPIYLDYAATTPVDPRVAEQMMRYLTLDGVFANPASRHSLGVAAKQAVDLARSQVAELIHADPSEIIFTSGAYESNNLALKGAAHLYRQKGKHIITLKTEHKSVLESCQHLEKEGFIVTYLTPMENGLVYLDILQSALREDTMLVSIMQVNNELGVIQNLPAIAALTSACSILLHVDAAQSAGKIAIDVTALPVDLLSLCAHKVYGPKGIGALYVRKKPRIRVEAQIHGGGQEQGMRAGTLATHQMVGMGEAFRIATAEMAQDEKHVRLLRDRFLRGLSKLPNILLNTDLLHSVPHILNLRIEGLCGQSTPMAISTVSACQNQEGAVSYVLRALGQTEEQARNALRFSFGRWTTAAEIDAAVA